MIGRVIRATMRSFVFGARVPESGVPTFGALVKTAIRHRQTAIYGLIFDIAVNADDDGMTKMLSVSDNARDEDLEWQRSRLIPLDVSVLCVGYREQGGPIRRQFPPQPPIALNEIEVCDDDELRAFTERFDHFGLILDSRDAPCNELLAAHLSQAAGLHPEPRSFVVAGGRELARLLPDDSLRLEQILRRVRLPHTP